MKSIAVIFALCIVGALVSKHLFKINSSDNEKINEIKFLFYKYFNLCLFFYKERLE